MGGQPKHSYRLHSVVSHYGASVSSGHYVADVFRFDGGGWHRYDDTRVTRTNSRAVRTGSNTANGYTHLHVQASVGGVCEAGRVGSQVIGFVVPRESGASHCESL